MTRNDHKQEALNLIHVEKAIYELLKIYDEHGLTQLRNFATKY